MVSRADIWTVGAIIVGALVLAAIAVGLFDGFVAALSVFVVVVVAVVVAAVVVVDKTDLDQLIRESQTRINS